MTVSEGIDEERRRYLHSGRSRQDWVRYVTAVEHLRHPGKPPAQIDMGPARDFRPVRQLNH